MNCRDVLSARTGSNVSLRLKTKLKTAATEGVEFSPVIKFDFS